MGTEKINDLIFKELVRRGYSVEDGSRVWNIADSKLWYLKPEQAQGYLDLDGDSSYKNQTGQAQFEELIEKNIRELKRMIGDSSVNIVDLGCGDGTKAAKIIQLLKDYCKIRYCPVDISGYMVEKAMENISKMGIAEIIDFQYNISDFENLENITPLLRKGARKNIILLLGNTLGNFEINELLYEIRTAMEPQDIFVVDTAIDDMRQEERAKSYQQNKQLYKWLLHIPESLGLEEKDVEMEVRFKNSRIEIFFNLKNSKRIDFQKKSVSFNKGDKLLVLIAYKYKKNELLTFLNLYFENVTYSLSKDKSKILAFCQK
ncbi:methyltransferase domain-containing protein [Candidatus Pacearchaeota archaeon]|nr:MAG: methyltransferase domain-containing protein [Candidatus Pacearchaeota archaeon]